MQQLFTFLQEEKPVKKGTERNDLFKQIYSFYNTGQEYTHRKKANWKRYVAYLKQNKIKDCKEEQVKFKKNKLFLKPMSERSMACFWLAHIPTKDLYYILSVTKDRSFRNEPVGAYLMSLAVDKSFDKK